MSALKPFVLLPYTLSGLPDGMAVPSIVANADARASGRFLEFFTATIRNRNTRQAYGRAVGGFLAWCESQGLTLHGIGPVVIATYVEQLLADGMSKPSVNQHLSAIRMMLDFMVTGGILPFNPAGSVRGPRHIVKVGKTPVLPRDDARGLLDTIDVQKLSGLRDRALLGVMIYSFARVSAVVAMDAGDYYQQGRRWWLRLHEKGGKEHAVPVHPVARKYLEAYLDALGRPSKGPLWRSMTKEHRFGDSRMSRIDVFRLVKRRCAAAGLGTQANCHTFRATGITAFLANGGSLEGAQAIASHESPRTTKLYDRTTSSITLAEIERISI